MSLSPEFAEWLGDDFSSFLLARNALLIATVAITLYSGLEYSYRGWVQLHQPTEET